MGSTILWGPQVRCYIHVLRAFQKANLTGAEGREQYSSRFCFINVLYNIVVTVMRYINKRWDINAINNNKF